MWSNRGLFRVITLCGLRSKARLICAALASLGLAIMMVSSISPHASAATGATVYGFVTDEKTGLPLANVPMAIAYLYPDGASAVTDNNGRYEFTAVWTDAPFAVCAEPSRNKYIQLDECFDDVPRRSAATILRLHDGQSARIDFQLRQGALITGMVTVADSGAPIADVAVYARTPAGDLVAEARTNGNGSYTLAQLAPGSYRVAFFQEREPTDPIYQSEYFDNRAWQIDGDLLTVVAGDVLSNVNATLEPGGQIVGTIMRDVGGGPVRIEVIDTAGRVVYSEETFETNYAVYGLPAGDYRLRFSGPMIATNLQNLIPVYFSQQSTLAMATTLKVRVGQPAPIANVIMALQEHADLVATAPGVPSSIFMTLAGSSSPIITTDGGQTWSEIVQQPWPSSPPLAAIAVSYRTAQAQPLRLLAYHTGGLSAIQYRTGDFGATWDESSVFVCPPGSMDLVEVRISTVVPSPMKPSELYLVGACIYGAAPLAHTSHPPASVDAQFSIYRTIDGGVTWHRLRSGERILPSPVLANRLYVFDGDPAQWWVSDDATTWTPTGIAYPYLHLDGAQPGWMYADHMIISEIGYPQKYTLARSQDAGASWTQLDLPCQQEPDWPPQSVAVPNQAGWLLLNCFPEAALYRSTDGGASWTMLADQQTHYLGINWGAGGDVLWGNDEGLWSSSDGGDAWRPLRAFPLHFAYLSELVR